MSGRDHLLLSGDTAVERVEQKARDTFGSDEKARVWLRRPTTAFDGRSPLEILSSGPIGAERVLDFLTRIDHGLAV